MFFIRFLRVQVFLRLTGSQRHSRSACSGAVRAGLDGPEFLRFLSLGGVPLGVVRRTLVLNQ